MKLLYFPLGVLIILGMINIFLGIDIPSVHITRLDTNIHINLDLKSIGISILIGSLVAIALIGFNILGSGLNDSATHLITYIIFYAGIWLLLTPLCWNLIMTYETTGILVYFVLMISYIIGVITEGMK